MRFALILLFVFPLCLTAQVDPFGNGFQISLTLEPTWQRNLTIRPRVTAADTVLWRGGLTQGRLSGRRFPPDTIRFNGTETVYYSEPTLDRTVRRKQAIFKLLSSVRLHYRFNNNFEISTGLLFQQYDDDRRPQSVEEFPEDFFYSASRSRSTYFGVGTDATYHFLRDRKFRPYAGLQLRTAIFHFETRGIQWVFPGENREEPRLDELRPAFRQNTIFDFDLKLLAGVNYQFADRWMVGFEAHLNRYLIPIPRALQVRYRLGSNRREAGR
jgi:hypothetical protein